MVVRVKGCWGEFYCRLTPERGGRMGCGQKKEGKKGAPKKEEKKSKK